MSHVTQRVVSKDFLQDSAELSASGNGTYEGAEVVRKVRSANIIELWVNVSAVGAGFVGEFVMESRLEGIDGWVELARVALTTMSIGTPPKAYASAQMARGDKPLGEEVRSLRDHLRDHYRNDDGRPQGVTGGRRCQPWKSSELPSGRSSGMMPTSLLPPR